MNLHILFGQRKQSYDGEHAPETLLCWTEYDIDENPEGFDAAVAEAKKKAERDFSSTRVLIVKVDGDKLDRLLNKTPVAQGARAVISGEIEEP